MNTNEPDPLVTDYLFARAAYDRAKAQLDEAQASLIKQMQADQQKDYKWIADGRQHHLTYVRQKTTQIDERGLRKALTAKVYDRFTVRKLNRDALNNAMLAGEVDKVLVSKYCDEVPKRPYLTYTDKVVED